MEMEIISRESIKPSSPTPPELRIYPLSFIDHISPRNYVPTLFFYYPNNQSKKISMLKKSLSELVSIYYPFAGRLRDRVSIDCNDEGVTLIVTNVKSNLSDILRNPEEKWLNPLFPDELQWKELRSDNSESILSVQINVFACGGMAISVCMCHKVGDAATLFNLVNDWSTINRGQEGEFTAHLDVGSSLFPHADLPVFPESGYVQSDTVCRRFVFHASNIDSLKALLSSHVPNPTRVELVTALIYKCAVSALGLSFKTTSLLTAVNIRKRTVPPLPQKTVGNLVWFLFAFNPFAELHELVNNWKQRLRQFCDTYAKKFVEKDMGFIRDCMKQVTNSDCHDDGQQALISCASWCRFPMYEADFGWGKPIWVTTSRCPVRNSVVLMDTKDGGGIEALVNMEHNDMLKFERSSELLQYASLNPMVGLE